MNPISIQFERTTIPSLNAHVRQHVKSFATHQLAESKEAGQLKMFKSMKIIHLFSTAYTKSCKTLFKITHFKN